MGPVKTRGNCICNIWSDDDDDYNDDRKKQKNVCCCNFTFLNKNFPLRVIDYLPIISGLSTKTQKLKKHQKCQKVLKCQKN